MEQSLAKYFGFTVVYNDAYCCAAVPCRRDSTPTAVLSVKEVKSIHVGEIVGASVEASRFRMLLQQYLTKQGFVVSATPDKADTILSGVIDTKQVRVSSFSGDLDDGFYGSSRDVIKGYSTVQLINRNKDIIWSDSFSPSFLHVPFTGYSRSDGVKNRALDIAKQLAKLKD